MERCYKGPRGVRASPGGYAAAVRRVSRSWFLIVVPIVLVAGLGVAGCGSKSNATGSTASTTSTSAGGGSGHIAKPVSARPSTSAKMVCSDEVKGDVAELLGVPTVKPLSPTWIDHVFSCRFVYRQGAMTLSVKEFADQAETNAYFASLATKLGKTEDIQGLGQGAFTTKNLSAVVRKDYKVLVVDISQLPPKFGNPPDSRGNIALNVASTIMSCWTGA